MLREQDIFLNQPTTDKDSAIKRCGELLKNAGYADAKYTEGMLRRDESFSTAIGNLIAIPHGEKEYKQYIKKTGLCVLTYPEGIQWGENTVKLVVGIAAIGDEHLEILEHIVDVLEEEEDVENLVQKSDVSAILKTFLGD